MLDWTTEEKSTICLTSLAFVEKEIKKNRVSVVGLPTPACKVRGLARGFQGFYQTSETPLRAKPKDRSGTSVSSWLIFSDDCQPQCIPLHPGRASGL